MDVASLSDADWELMDAADAIIFGTPTSMGTASGAFHAFAEATSKRWMTRAWSDKLAAGFSNSGSMNGDKLHTLQYLSLLAAQHGMLWVSLNLLPDWNTTTSSPQDDNRLGFYLGAGAQSFNDTPEVHDADLSTTRHLGWRVAEQTPDPPHRTDRRSALTQRPGRQHLVTFSDTAEMYGWGIGSNEILVGKAVRDFRDDVVLATKLGVDMSLPPEQIGGPVNGRPDNIRKVADNSLRYLGVEHIDVFYQHRVDPEVPIDTAPGSTTRPRAHAPSSWIRQERPLHHARRLLRQLQLQLDARLVRPQLLIARRRPSGPARVMAKAWPSPGVLAGLRGSLALWCGPRSFPDGARSGWAEAGW